MTAGPVFYLELWPTYYKQGFFNVPRRFDRLVGDEGSVTLKLRGHGPIDGYVNRRANGNGTARVLGRVALRDWFQENYPQGATVPVLFETPRRLTLG